MKTLGTQLDEKNKNTLKFAIFQTINSCLPSGLAEAWSQYR